MYSDQHSSPRREQVHMLIQSEPLAQFKAYGSVIAETASYALHAAVLLARSSRPRSAGDIARELDIPRSYLEKVLGTMARARIVTATRGARGGFRLAHDPATLRLAQVVAPFDSIAERPKCLLNARRCDPAQVCPAHSAWAPVASAIHDFFAATTLAAIAEVPATPVQAAIDAV